MRTLNLNLNSLLITERGIGMASPMPSGRHMAAQARVVVFVPNEMRFLLDQISRGLLVPKKSLHEDIWKAGVRAHLGIEPDDIEGFVITSLPRGTAAPKDAKRMAQALIVER